MSPQRLLLPTLLIVALPATSAAAPPPRGYQAKVQVNAPTRLDWTFAVEKRSVAKVPADWLAEDFDSTKQAYELYVPLDYNPKKAYPVVLFINAGPSPGGFKGAWDTVCMKNGVIFASPFAAGNDCKTPQRIRIVLDVLDDLRRKYNVDADRTYLTGMSGGGYMSCLIGFALPELFGGIAPTCAAMGLRDEAWLRFRVAERLSVAYLVGDSDWNRGQCELQFGPILTELGVRTKVLVAPQTGHALAAGYLPEVYKFLEGGVVQRRELAKKFPASRLSDDSAPSREEWSRLLLKEAKERLDKEETLYSGILQLRGIRERWDDLPAALEAKKLLAEQESGVERPWQKQADGDDLRLNLAMARGFGAYARSSLHPTYAKHRADFAKGALVYWTAVLRVAEETSPEAREARKQQPELRKLSGEKE